MLDYYVEHCRTKEDRRGHFIPFREALKLFDTPAAGYCSLYMFRLEDVLPFRAARSSSGLGRLPVYSERLWLDIDRENDLDAAKKDALEISAQLAKLGLAHSVWFSGGKGFHICIRTAPMFGHHVPASHAEWVEKNIAVKVDMSLYQHGRIFSNPGRVHEKTKNIKFKVSEHNGMVLQVPEVSWTPPEPFQPETDSDRGRIALTRVARLLTDEPTEGNRHTALWSTAGLFAEAGVDRATTEGLLKWLNQQWSNPKSDADVSRAIEQAFSQARGSRPA